MAIEIIGIGEVLWDLLPTGKALGGAPFNFAFHCHQLGHRAVMVSRVGRDALGDEIRASMRGLGLDDAFVQTDESHSTGTVSVAVDESGQPSYTIHEGAWDHLEWDDRLANLMRGAKAVCFGSLIQRHQTARTVVGRVLAEANEALTAFDVNLRQQFYTRDLLADSLTASRWAKLNDDELIVLKEMFSLAGSNEREIIADLRMRFALDLVALTRGEKGCLVQTADEEIDLPGERVKVVDTVGAGDAFTAALVCSILEGKSVGESARFANRYAARVAAARGGTPVIDSSELDRLRGTSVGKP
jgi:fructokinase